MKVLRKLAAVAALAIAPVASLAGPINLASVGPGYTLEGTTFSAPGVGTIIVPGIPGFTTDSLTVAPTLNVTSIFASDISDAATYDLVFSTDPLLPPPLVASDITASVASAIGFVPPVAGALLQLGSIEMVFENVTGTGSFSGIDGGAILVRLTDFGLDGATPLQTAGTGVVDVFVLEQIAPIPLPAGAWLLLTGAGALVLTRRRKAA